MIIKNFVEKRKQARKQMYLRLMYKLIQYAKDHTLAEDGYLITDKQAVEMAQTFYVEARKTRSLEEINRMVKKYA